MIRSVRRAAAAGLATALASGMAPPAGAVTPPGVDPSVSPPAGSVGPTVPMAQRGECVTTGLIPGTDVAPPPAGQRVLNLAGAWQFSRG